ncbi:MAG: TetR/AcrR family transcriptional regulator [Bacteroidales bacterium]
MQTKELILRTAFQLFASENFESVSMSRLEKATGLSKGAFYHHFKSKEEIFIQAMDMLFFNTLEEVENEGNEEKPTVKYGSFREFFSSRLPTITGIAMQAAALRDNSSHDFPLFGIMTTALRHYPDFALKAAEMEMRELQIWKCELEEAQRRGELCKELDPLAVASLFLAITDGVGIRAMLTGRQSLLQEMLILQFEHLYGLLQYRQPEPSVASVASVASEEKPGKGDKSAGARKNSHFIQQSLF